MTQAELFEVSLKAVSETYRVVVLVPDLADWRHEFALHHQMIVIIALGQQLNRCNPSDPDVDGRESKHHGREPGPSGSGSPRM
jgi:hypothetical protein